MVEESQQVSRAKSPRSARLPQVPIERALPIARALQELAAPSTPHRIAQRLGVSPSAGAFRTVLGAAGYYGLIRQEGERRVLTDLGERALLDNEGGLLARQQAVAQTGFRNILGAFRGREVNEGVIAARLQDDLGVPASASVQITRALVTASEQVELVVRGRFDAEAIENALARAPEVTLPGAPGARSGRGTAGSRTAVPAPPAPGVADQVPPSQQVVRETRVSGPTLHIDIQLHIPATATAEQIDQIFASMAKHLYGRE